MSEAPLGNDPEPVCVPLEQLLAGKPPGAAVDPREVARRAASAGRVLVVLDDDPTGTQSVADLPVLLTWTVEAFAWAFAQGTPAVYVMTNSRSLDGRHAERRNREVARAAFAAAEKAGVTVDFVSRSDSTLRGHFPAEPATLAQEVSAHDGRPVDGVVIVPAFGDAGRITVDAVHYAGCPTAGFTPVGQTEYARDATFGYTRSDLREWVAEKTAGAIPAERVAWIPLAVLRTDPTQTAAILAGLAHARPVVVDIVDEDDLRRLALALYDAEAAGRRFIYRVAPPFPRAVIGQPPRAPLSAAEVAAIRDGAVGAGSGAGDASGRAAGGLIVVGSHVSTATRQLGALVVQDHPEVVEIDVGTVLLGGVGHVADVARRVAEALPRGNVVVTTSRSLVRGDDAEESLAIARQVSAAVVEVVRRVLARTPPRFVVAKGGITSSDVAAKGLSIERAMVRGPMLPGIVSLWEPVDGPAKGIPYVVFAGNVGGPTSLAEVVRTLSA
ncbi:MAG: hypothetical protein IPK37_03925 [Austwickia sp.]|nr:MAG: hypothetical protein IPK37_03925 [Austwickia sp.]